MEVTEWGLGVAGGVHILYMGGCQNYCPFLGTLNIRGHIIIGTQKGTIILTTTHIYIYMYDIPILPKPLSRKRGLPSGPSAWMYSSAWLAYTVSYLGSSRDYRNAE